MVVLDILPSIEVWIEVNNEPLEEYEDQDGSPDKKKCVTRYIAAQSGQSFGIGVEAKNTQGWKAEGLDVEIKIDGVLADAYVWAKKAEYGYTMSDSMALSNGKCANFKFSALDIGKFGRARRQALKAANMCE